MKFPKRQTVSELVDLLLNFDFHDTVEIDVNENGNPIVTIESSRNGSRKVMEPK